MEVGQWRRTGVRNNTAVVIQAVSGLAPRAVCTVWEQGKVEERNLPTGPNNSAAVGSRSARPKVVKSSRSDGSGRHRNLLLIYSEWPIVT